MNQNMIVSFHSWLNNIVQMQRWPLDRCFLYNYFHSLINLCCFNVIFLLGTTISQFSFYKWDLQIDDRQVGEFVQLDFHLEYCHLLWQVLDWTIYHIDYHFCCPWSLPYYIGCKVIQSFPKLNCSCIKVIKKFHPVLYDTLSWLIFTWTVQISFVWNSWVHLPSSWATQTQKWDENDKGHSKP